MNRDQFYLLDVYQYAQDVAEFVNGMNEASFLVDRKTQQAVLYSITIIGEATKKLSPEFRTLHSHIPWKQIAGMRDKCVHDYRQVDINFVWQVTQSNIPQLLKDLEPLLPRNN